jgi:2-methylcitrate dehydratase
VLFKGRQIELERALGSYVMENVLFKISFPAEFHAQTAVEAALSLHVETAARLDAIERIEIETQEPGVRIIDKTGPLANPADRDHCLQYMVAVPLIFGRLTADDYEDEVARDARIDALREKMVVRENRAFSRDYLDPDKRAIGNALQVFFKDGTSTPRVAIDYPVGHRRRRAEGIPLLLAKFRQNLATQLHTAQISAIEDACADQTQLEALPVDDFVALWVKQA